MNPSVTDYSNSSLEDTALGDSAEGAVHRCLTALLQTADRHAALARDPLQYVHRYARPVDQEVVGLVASSLAFGNVVAVRNSVERVLDALGERPADTLRDTTHATISRRLRGFTHRIYRGPHVARLLGNAQKLIRQHDSLGEAFCHEFATTRDFRESLATFASQLRGPRADRSMKHLVSDPRAGSACKRLLLYMRWMVRPSDGFDLGLWDVPASSLVIPVDTHVHRISRHLGLTERNDASWRTAEEITAHLRKFDPSDPVKFDFALCHLGISRQCPSKQDPLRCGVCVLKPVCRVWQAPSPSRQSKR